MMDEDREWVRARYPEAEPWNLERAGLSGWVLTRTKAAGVGSLLSWGPTEAEAWEGARESIQSKANPDRVAVLASWPRAYGQRDHDGWSVYLPGPGGPSRVGVGETEAGAWRDARERVEAEEARR